MPFDDDISFYSATALETGYKEGYAKGKEDAMANARIMPLDNFKAIQKAVRDLLVALGEDPEREGLKDTPLRIAKLYNDVLDGAFTDLKASATTSFGGETYNGQVMIHHVPFYAFCEHHLLPFQGHFGIGYVPNQRVLGLSKVVRIFRHHTKRVTIQERITEQAVDTIMRVAQAKGAICYVAADHMCMTLRGVKSPGALTTTIASRGVYEENLELRSQFLNEASKVRNG